MKTQNQIQEMVANMVNNGVNGSWYAKFARISAVAGVVGEEVITNTSEGQETVNTVKEEGDMIATNPSGERYIIDAKNFAKKYEASPEDGENVYRPKGGPQLFIQLSEAIEFIAPWGEEMKIAAGGYLNITNPKDIYGIQPQEFAETYAPCNAPE